MCGILGFFKLGLEDSDNRLVVEAMLESIEHRGPDEKGYKILRNGLVLGMCRLSIVDVQGSHQPMSTFCEKDSHLSLVFNGEIYNFLEIQKELLEKGHKFNSLQSDTEMILHAFAEWGTDCFEKFDGMFAIAIFSEIDLCLYLVRDRFGEKPLFIFQKPDGGFLFASEVKSIQKYDSNILKINDRSEYSFLVKGMSNSLETLFHDLSQVDGGTVVRLSLSGERTELRWHKFKSQVIKKETPTRNEIEETFREYFLESVKERVSTEVPTGLFLSGGLDSSGVAVALTELGLDIKAFSIGFNENKFDESAHIKLITDQLGLRNEIQFLEETDLIENFLDIAKSLDEPIADPSIFPTYMVAKLASNEVKVALWGDGSDELSFGYNFNEGLRKLENLNNLVNRDAIRLILKMPFLRSNAIFSKARFASEVLNSLEDGKDCVSLGLSPFKYERHHKILKYELLSKDQIFGYREGGNFLLADVQDTVRNNYLNGYLKNNILVKTDRMTMLNSIELRSPFLDKKLSDFLLMHNYETHRLHGNNKSLLRSYLRHKLPKQVLNKRKSGFGFPLADWLRSDFGIFVGEVLSYNEFYPDYIDKKEVLKLLTEHKKGVANNSDILWSLLILLSWRQNMLKGETK